MDDEEFRASVMRGLQLLEAAIAGLRSDVAHLDARLREDKAHLDRRLDAVVSRLDEQDNAYDRLIEKVDRLGVAVRQSLEASEQALTAVSYPGRRVTRLEHPEGDPPPGRV